MQLETARLILYQKDEANAINRFYFGILQLAVTHIIAELQAFQDHVLALQVISATCAITADEGIIVIKY